MTPNTWLKVLLGFLVANALLFMYNLLLDIRTHGTSTPQEEAVKSCCKHICEEDSITVDLKTGNIKKLLQSLPKLDPSYLQDTLVRLGSDLNIDFKQQCPNDSTLLHTNTTSVPKHLDCPTLFLIGARKAGTSSLYHYISKHPDFRGTKMDAGPKVGETFFFSNFYKKRTWKQYVSLFPKGGVMTGDASVGNFVHNLAPKRLFQSCGKLAKVVVLLRNPLHRFQSNFFMRARLKRSETLIYSSISLFMHKHLNEFLRKVHYRTVGKKQVEQEWKHFVDLFSPAENLVYEGLYYVHLMNWLCNFPAENVMIVNSEEFYRNTGTILDLVFQFLTLKRLDQDTYNWITSVTYNKGKFSNISASRKMSGSDRTLLMGAYRPFNQALLDLLRWESVDWQV